MLVGENIGRFTFPVCTKNQLCMTNKNNIKDF